MTDQTPDETDETPKAPPLHDWCGLPLDECVCDVSDLPEPGPETIP